MLDHNTPSHDIFSLIDENGVIVRGKSQQRQMRTYILVFTEAPFNGKRVNLFTRDELTYCCWSIRNEFEHENTEKVEIMRKIR
jgi:hypothetical protein